MAIVVTEIERLPPNDLAAEQAVVGSILINPDVLPDVAYLAPADFFHPRHAVIFRALLRIYDRGSRIDLVTVARELEVAGDLDTAGGIAYLTQTVADTPTSLHAKYYAAIVHHTSLARQLISAAGSIAQLAYNAGDRIENVIAECVGLLSALSDKRTSADARPLADVVEDVANELVSAEQGHAPVVTSFLDVDRIVGGFHAGELIILAARPGFGKSALALQIARNVADSGQRVAVFSLEMAATELAKRLIAADSGVPHFRMKAGEMNEQEVLRFWDAVNALGVLPILICDEPIMRPGEIRGRVRRLHQQEPLSLVVIDYLQLLDGSNGRRDGRQQEVADISHALKALARELSLPVLALAQLNREVERRAGQRPMLSDLRDSGSLEQDADSVIFLNRPDQYQTEDEWVRRHPTEQYPKGVVEVIIAKHRNGPTGEARLLFQGETTKFVNMQRGVR